MATRSSNSCHHILNETYGEQHLNITGTRLPTKRQVLLCYLANSDKMRNEDISNTEPVLKLAIQPVIDEISLHYRKANIQMVHERTVARKITALHNEYVTLRKIPPKKRLNNPKVNAFLKKIKLTMPLWPEDIFKIMENQKKGKVEVEKLAIDEDMAFLRSMISDRIAHYSNQDKKTTSVIRKRSDRKKQVLNMHKKHNNIRIDENDHTELSVSDDEDFSDHEFNPILTTTPVRSHKRTVKTGTTITIPPDILKSPILNSVCIRNKITPTEKSALLHAIITECNGSVSAVNLSVTTAYKYNFEVRDRIVENIKSDWTPPSIGLLQWDGKLILTLDGFGKEERLPVLISGIGGSKLLGVPAIHNKSSDSTGKLIAQATVPLLEEWNCKDSVVGMVFDTTASNTGHKTAGCIQIQISLNKPLLWFACRHHIGEVILTHVWTDLKIETSKSPIITVFER